MEIITNTIPSLRIFLSHLSFQRFRILYASFIFFWMVIGEPLNAQPASEKVLRSIYARYIQAVKKKDAKYILSLETPDFTRKLITGQIVNRYQADAHFLNTLRRVNSIDSVTIKTHKIETTPTRATIVFTQTITGTTIETRRKTHRWTDILMSRDTWVKTNHGWRIKRSEDLKNRYYVNGKLIYSQ